MRGAIALLAAVAGATSVGVLLAMAAGGASPLLAALALAAGAGVGALALWKPLPAAQRPTGWIAWSTITLFALFALRGFGWLIFERDDAIAFLSPNNLGDLSIHLTFIRYLASGVSFWPANPIYAAEGLHYPFGMDWLNSLLLLAGVEVHRGLIWTGLLGAATTAVLLWRWGGTFVLAGFLFNGGFAAWRILSSGELADFQGMVEWKSIPLAMFITQRGLLYAIPAGLALLWSWRERFYRGQRGLPLWLEVLLYGTMPLFHLHTFLFLSWMLAAWGVAALAQRQWQRLRELCSLTALAAIPATVLVWRLTGGFQAGSAIHWKPGWMQGEQPAVFFWLDNFGVLLILMPALLITLALRRSSKEDAAFAIPAIALFFLCCFVMFAAWEWDNTKLFLWCYLALLPPLWGMIRCWPKALQITSCVMLFASGALSLAGGLRGDGYELARRSELDALSEATRDIPPEATFAAVPTYNHPLLLLGRKLVMGYEGHLSSHGIDYSLQKQRLDILMRGAPGWQDAAVTLKADYLFVGPRERKAFEIELPSATDGNLPAWQDQLPVVAEGEWGLLLKLPPSGKPSLSTP